MDPYRRIVPKDYKQFYANIVFLYSKTQNETVKRCRIIHSPEQTPAEAFRVETKKLLVPYRRLALTKPGLVRYKIQDL